MIHAKNALQYRLHSRWGTRWIIFPKLTELLYCTSMPMRCDLPLDNLCIILAKLIAEKKFRHEYSRTCSTSSSCFSPLGRMVVLTMVCLAGRGWFSSDLTTWGFFEKPRQYWKKLLQWSVKLRNEWEMKGLAYYRENPLSRQRSLTPPEVQTSWEWVAGSLYQASAALIDGIS